jgi:hypothetical protein
MKRLSEFQGRTIIIVALVTALAVLLLTGCPKRPPEPVDDFNDCISTTCEPITIDLDDGTTLEVCREGNTEAEVQRFNALVGEIEAETGEKGPRIVGKRKEEPR